MLASGSLDNEVRLWNANTAECVGSKDFCEFLKFPSSLSLLCACCPRHAGESSDSAYYSAHGNVSLWLVVEAMVGISITNWSLWDCLLITQIDP